MSVHKPARLQDDRLWGGGGTHMHTLKREGKIPPLLIPLRKFSAKAERGRERERHTSAAENPFWLLFFYFAKKGIWTNSCLKEDKSEIKRCPSHVFCQPPVFPLI